MEKNLRGQEEVVRFTIMHELDHAYVQRFAFYLIVKKDLSTLSCVKAYHALHEILWIYLKL